MELTGRDPVHTVRVDPWLGERLVRRLLADERDMPFVGLIARISLTVVPTGVALFIPGLFSLWLAALHLALVIFFMGPFVLMLHNTSHRRFFNARWRRLNLLVPWVLGPFFGESPDTFFAHHVGMHHAENNLAADLSSTLGYRRDSFVDFIRYFLRFFFVGIFELSGYFARKNRRGLLVRCVVGELSFLIVMAALLFVSWRATVAVLVLPFVITRFGMMAGNWAQHAFVDRDSPGCEYRNSITCIDSGYNRRCFNDGYHIGHHLKATMHWTDMPGDFLRNVDAYASESAIVFRGIDYFGVWLLLMLGRYDWLARRFVHLGATPRPDAEIEALLRSRTGWTLAHVPSPAATPA